MLIHPLQLNLFGTLSQCAAFTGFDPYTLSFARLYSFFRSGGATGSGYLPKFY